jgi:hypothetical protein
MPGPCAVHRCNAGAPERVPAVREDLLEPGSAAVSLWTLGFALRTPLAQG